MPKRKSSAVILAEREELLVQPQFDQSFDEREVEGQEDFDPGEPKDADLIRKSLQEKECQRSGGKPKPLTKKDMKKAADLY